MRNQTQEPHVLEASLRGAFQGSKITFPARTNDAPIVGVLIEEHYLINQLPSLLKSIVGLKAESEHISKENIEKLSYLFSVLCELSSVGAPFRLIIEAFGHPIVAPEGQTASAEERRSTINNYMQERFRRCPILATENTLSQVPLGSVGYEMPRRPFGGVGGWGYARS